MGVSRRKTAAEKKAAAPRKTASAGDPKARARAASSTVRTPKKEQPDSTLALTSRVLFRRNTDHQVDRCMQLKLGMYPRAQLEQHLNSSGKNIASAIKGELYRLWGSRRHMPLQFWKDMIIDHRLSGCLMDGLQKPQQSQKVNKDLDLALEEAHHENPAKKSCVRLIRYLQHTDAMNETETYGLLLGAIESPSLSGNMSESIMEAVVEYWAKHKCSQRFPQFHDVCKDHFDFTMAKLWKKAQHATNPRRNWRIAQSCSLPLFLDIEDALKVDEAVNTCEEPSADVVSSLAQSTVGSELFQPEAVKAEFKVFIDNIDEKVGDL